MKRSLAIAATYVLALGFACATPDPSRDWPTESEDPLANAAAEVEALEQPTRTWGPGAPAVEVPTYHRERDVKDIPAEDDTEGQISEEACTPTVCTLPHVPEVTGDTPAEPSTGSKILFALLVLLVGGCLALVKWYRKRKNLQVLANGDDK
jgi:hypothetical protein